MVSRTLPTTSRAGALKVNGFEFCEHMTDRCPLERDMDASVLPISRLMAKKLGTTIGLFLDIPSFDLM